MARDDDFEGRELIILQPGDTLQTYRFNVRIASTVSANDGKIGFGRTISSAVCTAHTEADATAVTSILNGSCSVSGSNVLVQSLDYPTEGEGDYHLKFVCTLDNSSTKELDFNRIECLDR